MHAEIDGRTVDLGGPRQRALVARLVVARGQVVSTDRLIDDLWEGEPPPKALAALQVHISHLRRLLEPTRVRRAPARVIVSTAPGYALHLPDSAVDVWAFEADMRTGLTIADPGMRRTALRAALTRWEGEPLGAYLFTSWATAGVDRWARLHRETVQRLAATCFDLGDPAETVALLHDLVRDHPDAEDTAALLARAQYRIGRQADALSTLRMVRAHLVDELGVDPGSAIRDLEADILAHADHLDAPERTDPSAPAAPTSEPEPIPAQQDTLTGREAEVRRLMDLARAVTASNAVRVVTVVADAGSGKSTLLRAASGVLRQRDWTVAVGHCPEVDGAPAAWAWHDVLSALGASTDIGDAFTAARAVSAGISALAADRPVAIVVEDVHRADSVTLQILRQVVGWLADRPTLVLLSYRPHEVSVELAATLGALAGSVVERMELGGLGDDGIRQIAGSVGLDDLDDTGIALLRSRTGANPLYVREFATLVAAEGWARARSTVPAGVRDVLGQRIARLPAGTARMLRIAAVCGQSVDVDVLLALSGDVEDDLLDEIDMAEISGLVTSTPTGQVRFTHVLIRDTVYAGIPALRRGRMHWSAFEILSRRDPRRFDDLAVHAAAGASESTAEQALDVVRAAARRRDAQGARADSVTLWRSTITLHELAGHDHADAETADRRALVTSLCDLVPALAYSGAEAQARAVRDRAITLAVAIGDPHLTVSALTSWRAPVIWSTQVHRIADVELLDLLSRYVARSNGVDRVRLLTATVFEAEGHDLTLASSASEEAARMARELDDLEALCAALNARTFIALGPDLRDELPPLVDELLAAADAADLVPYRALGHFLAFLVAARATDLPAARSHVDQSLESATGGQVAQLAAVLSAFDAVLDVLRGDLDSAHTRYQALSRRLIEAGSANGAVLGLAGEIVVGWARGSIAHLVTPLAPFYAEAPDSAPWFYAVALLDAGELGTLRTVYDRRHPISRDYYWSVMTVFKAKVVVAIGDTDTAAEVYDDLVAASGTMAGLDSGSVVFGPVDDALADLAQLMGDRDAARHHRDRAASVRAAVAHGLSVLDG
ncbi:BTAD domain-containing putative transcriptional regulator [Williamsia sterculiae]|uniref:DNA-binding transcriptional activator of the SARP family n=1 Tax=Williamsia sterculiae TaxID=1344003 RepID=A0A1N7GXU2_9NOCA|nr:BTAD domain-containing putative transcriptional regulator [Williamsia sterculiae]SIS17404.1 DNA-binding transcriptional activator of the SARP family [Williamsia sterculiae]